MDNENIESLDSPEPQTPNTSTLSVDTPVATAIPSEYDYVPEKFMADGKPDFEKMSGSYKSLEGKLGTRMADAASSTDDYSYIPEGVEITNQEQSDAFKQLALDNGLSADQYKSMLDQYATMNPQAASSAEDYNYDFTAIDNFEAVDAFKEDAIKMGLSPDQYAGVMKAYEAELGNFMPNAEQTESSLKDAWGADYDQNLNQAFDAVKSLGIDVSEVKGNPAAIKILAKFGSEMREDSSPNGTSNTHSSLTELEVQDFMKRPDYFQNKEIQKQVSQYYAHKNR